MRDLVPVGVELDRGHREHEQAEAEIAEEPLEPAEGQHPRGHHEQEDRERDQQAVGQAREQLEADRDAAHLGGARHEVDDLGGDQRRQPRAEAGPLAHEVEDGPPGDRRDTAAHLRVDDDPDHPDDDDPEQLEPERRARLRVEHEIADVDEAADRRHDPERDREYVLHAHASCSPMRSL